MKCYPWPGNVRELENCVEKMVVMAPGRELTPDLLPMAIMAYNSDTTSQKTGDSASLNTQGSSSAPQTAMDENTFETMVKEFMQENTERCHQEGSKDLYNIIRCKWERYLFEAVLTFCQNNKSKAAQLLGITRNTLNSRLNDISTEKREWTI